MIAGFASADITPALGTPMMGFAVRDYEKGCEAIHDPLSARALFVEHDGEAALILGLDLCFVARDDADRLKGAIGRRLDLLPRQILINTSHTHVGPEVGTWAYAAYRQPDAVYLERLTHGVVEAAVAARRSARPARMSAGQTRSSVPLNRRLSLAPGNTPMRPNPDGLVYDALPVVRFDAEDGRPIALLFSIACHPSSISGFAISAEYPGVARRLLDEHLGGEVSLFLQGTAGDAKPRQVGDDPERWRVGDWDDVEAIGETLAGEVRDLLARGLTPVEPRVRCASVEMSWPLQPVPSREDLQAVLGPDGERLEKTHLRRLWAQRQLARLDADGALPTAAVSTLQGIQLGDGLRLVAMEGEPTAPYGYQIAQAFDGGLTVPLGYSNGQALYMVTSAQLDEGGMEAQSWYEYGFPAPLAKGMEPLLDERLGALRAALERG